VDELVIATIALSAIVLAWVLTASRGAPPRRRRPIQDEPSAEPLEPALARALRLEREGSSPSRLIGARGGRRVRAWLLDDVERGLAGLGPGPPCLRLAVACDPAPRVVVARESRKLGAERVVIRSLRSGKEAISLALEKGLREVVDETFGRFELERIVVDGGEVAALVMLTGPPSGYAELPAALERLARCFDRVRLPIRVLGGERQALGLAGEARCAYCHDRITGDEQDLVACRACSTVLHDACWAEHGSCPVLGCSEVDPERPRELT
jgi:hypothetical protein